jgi:hypothetical protein
MIDGKRVLGLVPARAGSQGLPGKNLRPLAGRPLIGWTLAAGQASNTIDRLVVTTDDEAVIALAETMGVETLRRPAELADASASVIDAIDHALISLGRGWDYVVLLQPTSPLAHSRRYRRRCRPLPPTEGALGDRRLAHAKAARLLWLGGCGRTLDKERSGYGRSRHHQRCDLCRPPRRPAPRPFVSVRRDPDLDPAAGARLGYRHPVRLRRLRSPVALRPGRARPRRGAPLAAIDKGLARKPFEVGPLQNLHDPLCRAPVPERRRLFARRLRKAGSSASAMAVAMASRELAQSMTLAGFSRPACRSPTFTDGTPAAGASITPLEEFPTTASQAVNAAA